MIDDIIVKWGIIAVFFMMLLNGSISTPPSELVISSVGALSVVRNEQLLAFFLTIVIANYIGTSVLFFLSYYKGKIWYDKILSLPLLKKIRFIDKIPTSDKLIALWNNKQWLVFACRFLPVIRSIISIPAGIAKMNYIKFSVYSILGIIIWTTGWLMVGRFMIKNYLAGKYTASFAFILLFVLVYCIGRIIQKKITESNMSN